MFDKNAGSIFGRRLCRRPQGEGPGMAPRQSLSNNPDRLRDFPAGMSEHSERINPSQVIPFIVFRMHHPNAHAFWLQYPPRPGGEIGRRKGLKIPR